MEAGKFPQECGLNKQVQVFVHLLDGDTTVTQGQV